MVDDVILGKAEIIERCLRRLEAVYAGEPRNLRDDLLRQDSIFLNLESILRDEPARLRQFVKLCLQLPE